MAQVLGLGGVFFKATAPQVLMEWYREHLGIVLAYPTGAVFKAAQAPSGAYSVLAAFGRATTKMAPSSAPYMINLIVDDVAGALEQVLKGGATQVGSIEEHEWGRFGWFVDPEGNKIELWQPPPAR